MPDEMTEAILGHYDEEPPMPSAPLAQETISTTSNSIYLAMPIKKIMSKKLSLAPPETWVPYYIHTAKCDRCGKHNTSVVQRSSRENKQFCKACMRLNVRDGLYSVNVEGLDWNPRTDAFKHRIRGVGKLRKSRKPKKIVKSSISTRVSKGKKGEPRIRGKKGDNFADHSGLENPTGIQFVSPDGFGDGGDETGDDIGFGQLTYGNLLSSEKQAIRPMTPKDGAEFMPSAAGTRQMELSLESGGKIKSGRAQYLGDSDSHTQWWERIRIANSDTRDENGLSSFTEQQVSEVSTDVLEAASILLKMRKGVR